MNRSRVSLGRIVWITRRARFVKYEARNLERGVVVVIAPCATKLEKRLSSNKTNCEKRT